MKPSFDTWTSVFLFAAIQGIFVAIILFFKNQPLKRERLILAIIVFLFSVTLIEYVLYWTRYQYYYPLLSNISGGFTFLYGPLFYYYFKIIFGNNRFKGTDLFSLIPFLTYIAVKSPYYFSSMEFKRKLMTTPLPPGSFHFPLWAWLSILSMIVYAILIFKDYKLISNSLNEIKVWFNCLFGFFAGFIISYMSYFILIMTPFFDKQFDYMISFAMSFFIYFLAWFGYMQPKVFSGFSVKEIIGNNKYATSALTERVSQIILGKLLDLMEKEKIYKNSTLSLEKLAERIDVSKHHLSQVINEQLGMNYFDYLNSLRVNEATKLLLSTSKKEMNIIEIAFEAGFNNKATFNNAFKKLTGMTPKEFREKQSPPVTNDKIYSN